MRKDGRCAFCLKPKPEPPKNAGQRPNLAHWQNEPFCSRKCLELSLKT